MLMVITIIVIIALVILEYRILYWHYYQKHWGKPWQTIRCFAQYVKRKK